jgi:hypothetical protein
MISSNSNPNTPQPGKVYQFTRNGFQPLTSQGLIIGQRVRQDHKGDVGVICEEESIGYLVIYPDGSSSSSQRLDQRSPFTRITLVDGIVSREEVKTLKQLRTAKRAADKIAAQQAKNQHALDIEQFVKELRTQYPWAKANRASANLKKELSLVFPGIKFSVVNRHGTSLDIRWTNGPTSKQVEAISDKYEDGHFNGMEDIHEYDHSAFGEAVDIVLGRTRYVFPSRSFSPRFLRDVAIEVCFEYGHETIPMVEVCKDGTAWIPEDHKVPYCNGAHDSLARKITQTAYETSCV